MNRRVYEYQIGDNCTVFVNIKFGSIRVIIKPDRDIFYVASDIAACMGYAYHVKVSHGSEKRFELVPWERDGRRGQANMIVCTAEEAKRFVDSAQRRPDGFRNWFFKNVIRNATSIGMDRWREMENAAVEYGSKTVDAKHSEYVVKNAFTKDVITVESYRPIESRPQPLDPEIVEIARKFDDAVMQALLLRRELLERLNLA